MPVASTGSLESTLTGAHFGDGGKRGVSGVWKTGLSHPISSPRQHYWCGRIGTPFDSGTIKCLSLLNLAAIDDLVYQAWLTILSSWIIDAQLIPFHWYVLSCLAQLLCAGWTLPLEAQVRMQWLDPIPLGHRDDVARCNDRKISKTLTKT